MLTVQSSKPVARKEHRCDECFRVIAAGERYARVEGPDDYGWRTWKACDGCNLLASDLFCIGVYSDNEYGEECYPVLSEVDWRDLDDDPVWSLRKAAWEAQWRNVDGSLTEYPSVISGSAIDWEATP